MNDEIHINCIYFKDLARQIKEVASIFEQITFTHIFYEQNMFADALSKEAQPYKLL
jgi:hypothetical protein